MEYKCYKSINSPHVPFSWNQDRKTRFGLMVANYMLITVELYY